MRFIYIPLIALFIMACENKKEKVENGYVTPPLQLDSHKMTPEVLWSFGRVSSPSVSPDEKSAVYTITYYHKEENRSYSDLYLLEVETGKSRRITDTRDNEYGATWTPHGKIAYMWKGQLWEREADGGNPQQITDIEGGIDGFLYAPDMKRIAYFKGVKLEPDIHDLHPDLPKANARLIDAQFYRHWDHWVEEYTHIFIADYVSGNRIKVGKDIMEGEKWESPVRPFGGAEQLCWLAGSETLVYTSRKKYGIDYARSTNTDLYAYDLNTGTTRNLTEGMMGYDINPILSPDGKFLAWESMERDGYEADKNRLFIMDLETGIKKDYTKDFPLHVSNLSWSKNGETIWFISNDEATYQIFSLNIPTGKITRLTEGVHDYTSITPAGESLIATKTSMSKPAEIYRVDVATGKDIELSFINKNILDQLKMGKVEKRWIKTTDQKDMLVWIIFPPDFDPGKKYPALLYCQGGPQSSLSQFWSYRWNFQMMAANDYIIIAPNRRGVPGFGQEWLEQISKDYSGLNIRDYFRAVDETKKEPYIDEDRLGCVGASYGGYSVYYLAGNHNKRFKAFISHCGIFDLKMKYYTTEEIWFSNWDLGGAPWEKDNKIAQRSYAHSPDLFVGNWDTPILVIHGQKDFRIDASQGMAAFNAARMKGVPTQYLYFPEEGHWVQGCQNGILWQRTFFAWLDRWLK